MLKSASRILALTASVFVAGSALAAPKFTHANGNVALSGPSQYVSFNAFDYGATGDRGTVSYTNFEYPLAGTGVWSAAGTYPLIVNLGGDFAHTMTIDTVTPVSSTATKFSGTGFYDADPSYTWTVTGLISGTDISFQLVYTGTEAGYTFDTTGTIAADGTVTGTATDSLGRTPLTFTIPAGSLHEVLSYSAPITCAVIGTMDGTFGFTIPDGMEGLSGTQVVAKVHDGGKPKDQADVWSHGVATAPCEGTTTEYPIVGGNIVVH